MTPKSVLYPGRVHTLEELARAVVSGSEEAWCAFQLEVMKRSELIVRGHGAMQRRGLHVLVDDVAEVQTATLERLWRNDFRALRRYFAAVDELQAEARQSFDSWLHGAVDFTVREHLRQRYGRAPKPSDQPSDTGVKPSKRDLNTNAGELSDTTERRALLHTLGMTRKLEARALLAHAELSFVADEREAFRLHYVEDLDFAEIAQRLGLADAKAADKLIRRLNARLRYRFGSPPRNG